MATAFVWWDVVVKRLRLTAQITGVAPRGKRSGAYLSLGGPASWMGSSLHASAIVLMGQYDLFPWDGNWDS